MTFDEWWEKPTDGWYLGRMATDDEKRYAQVAWEEATKAEREACAKTCEDEAKAIRREGEGSTNAQYDWMADGAERCAEALRSNYN